MSAAGLDPWRILLAVLAAAALLGLLPFVLRRVRPVVLADTAAQGGLEVVAQRALDLRHRVFVVRYRGSDHLLVLGGSLPVTLGRHDPPLFPDAREPRP